MPAMSLVSVPALCDFEHKGRRYVRGELVDCTPVEAAILARQQKVSLTRYHTTAVKTRRYRRRDMRAEE